MTGKATDMKWNYREKKQLRILIVFLYGLLSLICTRIYAQNPNNDMNLDGSTEDEVVEQYFTVIDTCPTPPEGLFDNLNRLFRYPKEAYDNDIEGRVIVGFIVTCGKRI